ncbi:YfcL family protein [Photobacterium damselae subsp. piscicida]|uniref:YfcL family protein n=1 Tax=Photobacterium damsela subsp. piscicida TaxID=38294 RepID=A0A1Q9H3M7_PHODP|nr:YfcL family protein [Photobacterium damselae]MBE8128654.1 YfcL family protein [Photobacterium damselae subsp. piscicida]MDP2514503.1 YfcL family protein [Photobacterium damselae subsp. piscicida]MDP2532225.1 YfcL family protein [Photobacterium damselae subsp. piscicida]MDP2544175.1 YfcL family protein [Photobacterium damselae subsp. piscicida]MDP2557740.1 YfcL family protein [Photobacterium damselae subsp. piscicida]
MTIQELEEKLLQYIDDSIDTATDDELFAGGYLRGHISLTAAECEASGINDLEVMKAKIIAAIDKARSELSPQDFVYVQEYITRLFNHHIF